MPLDLAGPQFSHLENGLDMNSTHLIGSLLRITQHNEHEILFSIVPATSVFDAYDHF